MEDESQTSTTIKQVLKAKRLRIVSHSSAHAGLSKIKRTRNPGDANWGVGSNGILKDACIQADHAYKLDQHINECSTKNRTRKRAIKAYQLTVQRLQMAIQYKEPNDRPLSIVNEPLDLAHQLIEEYTTRIEQLKAEENSPEHDLDEMEGIDVNEEDEEDEEDDEMDDEMDDGNETQTVTSTPPTPRTAANRNVEGRCKSLEWAPPNSRDPQGVSELH